MTKDQKYEAEKLKLLKLDLTPDQYDRAIQAICRKLKI